MRTNQRSAVLGLILFITSLTAISPIIVNGVREINNFSKIQGIESIAADTEPPSITISEPDNLSIVTGWFFLSVIATDNESIDKVVYRNLESETDYTPFDQNETDLTRFRALIDSRKYENGVNFFEIIANDTSNNLNRTVLLLAIQNLEAEADVYVYNVTGLTEDCPCLNDDNTSTFWNDIQAHPVLEFGGYVKFAHNFTDFFALIVYDSSLSWVSIEFDNDGDGICMENGEDLWWFAEGNPNSDYTSADFAQPVIDPLQDVIFEAGAQVGNDTNFKFFEIVHLGHPSL
ncbi:MAG: hypothetical protein ACXAC2_15300 [Candidatus Kariarchaeaceae archaeon]|jgi:hypothetical protein